MRGQRVSVAGGTGITPPYRRHATLLGLQPAAWGALALTVTASLIILFYYHNRFWLPRDDGYYAHIAERILRGEVLHRDVQALHPGYVYYLNALALNLFGHDLISLRYPLVAAGVAQAILLFLILMPRGIGIAMAGGFLVTALTIVQFFSPTAHWYCLPLFFALVLVLAPALKELRWRLELVGFLLVVLFLFRQLTGVFMAMGMLTYLFLEANAPAKDHRLLARTVIAIMVLGLGLYLSGKTDSVGWLCFGLWPLLAMLFAFARVRTTDRQTFHILLRLTVGGAVAALPLVLYHLASGSLVEWFSDAFIDAIALGEFDYQKAARFGWFLLVSAKHLARPDTAAEFLNGAYWLVLLLAPACLGVVMLLRLRRGAPNAIPVPPLPLLASFYALVAVHYQDPAYLYFALGPVFAGLLWYAGNLQRVPRQGALLAAGLYAATALYFHAGQPISRGYLAQLGGERQELVRSSLPQLAGLYVTPSDEKTYQALMEIIDRHSRPGDPILGVPAESELFFLTGRRNPLRYNFLPFGLRDDESVRRALQVLAAAPPLLVFHVPALPYNTIYTDAIIDWVRSHYTRLGTVREFDVYALPHAEPRSPGS